MIMHNPPHPGEFIKEAYLEPLGISPHKIALRLGVSPSTFLRLLKGQSGISPEMSLRLSKCLGRSPERMEEIIVSLFIQCLNNHAADDCDWEEERENIISRTNEEKWKNHARMIVAHVIKQERDVAAYATAWV